MPFLDVKKIGHLPIPVIYPINLEFLPTYPACMVSNPRGTPKSNLCSVFSIENQPFWEQTSIWLSLKIRIPL